MNTGKKSNGTHYCRKGEGVLIVAHIGRGSTVTVWGVGRILVVGEGVVNSFC